MKRYAFLVLLSAFFLPSTVSAAEPELVIWASPTSISAGQSSTIAWVANNVDWCHVYKKNNATGDIYGMYVQKETTQGVTSTGVLLETTTYTLGCSTASGLKTASVTIPLTGLPGTPTTPPPAPQNDLGLTIWSSPTSVPYGQPSTIAWVASDVDFCHVYKKNNATNEALGSYVVKDTKEGNASTGPLTETTTYTLGCSTASGLKTASVTIPVSGNAPKPTIVIEGESTSYVPHTFEGRGSWPEEVGRYWPAYNSATIFNVSAGGEKISTMLTEYATEVRPRANVIGEKYFFLFAGINDIEAGRSASAIYNDLKAEWALARADGFKVVAFTLMPSTLYTQSNGKHAVWQQLNALIVGDTSRYDYLVRPELTITNAKDTMYLNDGIHTSPEGARVIGRLVANLFGYALSSDQSGTPRYAEDTSKITCPALSVSLYRGMRGESVLRLQQFLTARFSLGADEITTGYFGVLTEKYVMMFQKEQGIPAIGIVGPLTRAAIERVCAQRAVKVPDHFTRGASGDILVG